MAYYQLELFVKITSNFIPKLSIFSQFIHSRYVRTSRFSGDLPSTDLENTDLHNTIILLYNLALSYNLAI